MKNVCTILVAALFSVASMAQSASAVIFSENGDKFTLLLNGEKKNDAPSANVKVQGLTGEFYQARIDFENPTLPDFSNNNFMVKVGIEVTYMIKTNKKGEYVLRYHSEAPMGAATASQPGAASPDTKRYAEVDDDVAEEAPATNSNTGNPNGVNMTTNVNGVGITQDVTITETTTTKTGAPATDGENVSMNMNVNGLNVGFDVNVTGMDTDFEVEESETTMTTTTTTTTSTSGGTTRPREEVVVVEEVSSGNGCARPMDKTSFGTACTSISSKSFEDTKLTTAKQVTKANCLTAAQIVEVMKLFSFEETRLEYAKFAYDFCYDKGNYYQVNDGFTYESSIDELNTYLESK